MTTFTKQVSKHGVRQYITPGDNTVSRNAFGTGGEGVPGVIVPGAHNTVAFFDDFLGDLLRDEWAVVTGDTGTVSTRALTTASGGVFRILNENTPLALNGENHALTMGLFKNWKANAAPNGRDGRLRMSARVKMESVATDKRMNVFIGFSDSGGAEMPAYDTGGGVISNAADVVGFLFGAGGTTTAWQLVSAKSTAGDSGDQLVASGVSPADNVWQTFEVEIAANPGDTGGQAHFWINGIKRGVINSPIGSAIALTPWIGMFQQDTGQRFLDVDYVNLSQLRDTGF